MIYSLYIIPFYNHFFRNYQHVILISHSPPPSSPLSQYVQSFPSNQLSPFIPSSQHCLDLLVFKNRSIQSSHFFLSPDDIPLFIDFLNNHNFTIHNFSFSQSNFPSTVKKQFILSFS